MRLIYRRFRLLVALVIIPALVLLPVASAFSVAPIVISTTVNAVRVALSNTTVGVAVSVALNSLLLYGLSFMGPDGTTEVLRVRLSPAAPQVVPAGWTAGSPPYLQPVPPATAGGVTQYKLVFGGADSGWQASAAAAAAASCAALGSNCHDPYTSGGNWWYCWTPNGGACPGGQSAGNLPATTQVVCPAGYSLSGASCTLTNAAVVVKPSGTVIELDGTAGSASLDALNPDPLPANFIRSSDGKAISVSSGSDSQRLTFNGDGSATFDQWIGRGDGTSDHTQMTIAPPASAGAGGGRAITGALKERVVGEGSSVGTAPSTGAAPAGAAAVCGGPGLPKCGVIVDETGTPTVVTGAVALAGTIADVQSKFDSAKTSGVGSLGVSGMDALSVPSTHEQGTFLHQLFPPSAACAPVTFTGGVAWGSHSSDLTVDICPVVAVMRPILEWLVYGLTAFYIYALFWRRKQGAA